MRLLILSFLLLMITQKNQAQNLNTVIQDAKDQKDVLSGLCDRSGLQCPLFNEFYAAEYSKYKPADSVMTVLKGLPKNYTITIVMGTWCGDSQEQVPRFYKILDEMGFPESSVTLICVDRTKTAGNLTTPEMKIEKVPTFIFYKDKTEIGRITETPVRTLEKDMMGILK
ncbi:MAG: thioredoxin family protein [Bacteroidota bacterium]